MAGSGAPRPNGRELLVNAGLAFAQVWAAAPGPLLGHLVATATSALAPVLVAWLTKNILDGVAAGAAFGDLVSGAVILAVTGAAVAVVPQVSRYLTGQIERASSLYSTDRLYRAVGRFIGLGRFEDPESLDRLRLADNSTRAPAMVVNSGLQAVGGALTVTGFIATLVVVSPVMTAIVLASSIPVLVAELWLSHRRGAMEWQIGPAERREFFYSSLLTEVNAAKEVRLYGLSDFLRGRMLTERRVSDSARRAMDLRETWTQGGLSLLGAAVVGGGLIWAVRAATQGEISVGDVSLFVGGVMGVQGAVGGLISGFAEAHNQLLMFDHYRRIVESEPDLPIQARPRPAPALRQGIELRDVWFRYSDNHPWALRGISVHIPHGRAVGLVGRNGAGKSTLVKLLCRFYDPTRGAIHWDGIDLRELDPDTLRRRLAGVFQDYMEYDLTAAENIGIGDLDGLEDHNRIVAAARRAGIHDKLVKLPHGYHTLLSRLFMSEADKDDAETGVVVSGGQWQRLALARALFRDQPDLMILDEPSSGLDAEAEARVHEQIRQHRAGRTSLLISHRMSSIRDADHIVVLDEGALAEQGKHDDLMARDGIYAGLFRTQAAGYTDDDADAATEQIQAIQPETVPIRVVRRMR
ncbi:ATP-binding cassette subfamily B protein [Pseudonocardia kunmingensis]|uniref:ATP-binding cassette subfamily B protein n=1 Tax=Pseudonocardia kunmingensis TaxID=630975 RepID=A0A543E3I2_9PSEU|nr:ATP-binding cassette subfamily B protein [Pseudonocardia kunmingensis]